MNSSDKSGSTAKRPLDLGLRAIVSPEPSPVAEPVRKQVTLGRTVGVAGQDWRTLVAERVARGEWGSVSQLCESVLDKDPENIAANIIWVQSQLNLGSMPVSLLVGPLESAVARLEPLQGEDSLKDVAGQLLRAIAGKTLDSRVVGALLERAAKLRGGDAPLDAQVGLSDELRDLPISAPVEGMRAASVGRIAVVLVLILGASWYLLSRSNEAATRAGDVSEVLQIVGAPASLVSPELQRVSALRGLEALLYDIEAREKKPEAPIAQVAVNQAPAVSVAAPVEAKAPVIEPKTQVKAPAPRLPLAQAEREQAPPAPGDPARPGFERVNTSGPLEPAIFNEIRRDREVSATREADTGQILFGEPKPEFNRRVPVLRPAERDRLGKPEGVRAGPARMSTMVKTRLMDRPSFRTKMISRPPSGDFS